MAATLTVLDLTSSLGLHALQRLHPSARSEDASRQLKLPGMGRPARLDWLRKPSSGVLPAPAQDSAGLFVIAGPGSASVLPALLASTAALNPVESWVLLAPNAIAEEWSLNHWLRAPQPAAAPEIRTLRLPSSDPQALWMILMEQFENLLTRHAHRLPSSAETDLEIAPMNWTLTQCLDAAMAIEGAMAVSLVDYRSGMSLGAKGSGLNLDLAAAGNSEVVRAKLRTAESLGFRGGIEDILITLPQQYHLIRLTPTHAGLFLYLVLDRQRGNLALARYKLTEIERAIKI